MADDNVDFRFLGQQVKNLQADVRDLRAGHLRLESDVVGMRAEISRIDGHLDRLEDGLSTLTQTVDNHHQVNQAQFAQMAQTDATNLQLILAEFAEMKQKLK